MRTDYYVYELRLDGSSTPFYIGKGRGRRAKVHFTKKSLSDGSHRSNTILKAQRNGITVHINYWASNLPEDIANDLELELISIYGRHIDGSGILTNKAIGGDSKSGFTHSLETRKSIGSAGLGRKHSPETVERIREAARRQIRKPVSEETRRKMSESRRGREMGPMSEEQKQKLREANLGKKHSAETRSKISKGLIGRPVSVETRAKISASNTGRVRDVSPEIQKLHNAKVSAALKGKPKHPDHVRKVMESRMRNKLNKG